jgi:hypothetical protein
MRSDKLAAASSWEVAGPERSFLKKYWMDLNCQRKIHYG